MLDVVWLIPALPLAGFLLILLFGRRLGEPEVGLPRHRDDRRRVRRHRRRVLRPAVEAGRGARTTWRRCSRGCRSARCSVDLAFLADPLSITMCLFVTGIGTLIHLYAVGYMHGDPRFSQVLPVPQPVRVQHVDAGARREPARHVPRVGGRRHLLATSSSRSGTSATAPPRPARRRSSPTASATGAS